MRSLIKRLKRLLIRTIQVVVGLIVVVVGLIAWNWTSLKNFAFRESLVWNAQAIRQSTCPLNDKILLLDRLDFLMEYVDEGKTVGVVRWMEFEQAIEPLLKDEITSDEQRLVEREMDRLERELRRSLLKSEEF